jgi:hypothetical protein
MSRLPGRISSQPVGRALVLLAWIGVFLVAAVLLIVFAAEELNNDGASRPEVLLPIIVITGVVALMATLAVAAALYGLFSIADKSQPLGLPPGSVQAVIALTLILIFAVVALYASSSSVAEHFASSGLTEAEFQAIPPAEVVSSTRTEKNGVRSYEVVRSVESPGRKDLNTQLLTTVSTLVVAVAGFYFGSKSVQEGSRQAIEAAGPNRSLLVTPSSPFSMEVPGSLTITVQSVPQGAELNWALRDDSDGRLLRGETGDFIYEPGKAMFGSGKSANLNFEQVEDPSTSASLLVKFPGQPDGSSDDSDPEAHPPEKDEESMTTSQDIRDRITKKAKDHPYQGPKPEPPGNPDPGAPDQTA